MGPGTPRYLDRPNHKNPRGEEIIEKRHDRLPQVGLIFAASSAMADSAPSGSKGALSYSRATNRFAAVFAGDHHAERRYYADPRFARRESPRRSADHLPVTFQHPGDADFNGDGTGQHRGRGLGIGFPSATRCRGYANDPAIFPVRIQPSGRRRQIMIEGASAAHNVFVAVRGTGRKNSVSDPIQDLVGPSLVGKPGNRSCTSTFQSGGVENRHQAGAGPELGGQGFLRILPPRADRDYGGLPRRRGRLGRHITERNRAGDGRYHGRPRNLCYGYRNR